MENNPGGSHVAGVVEQKANLFDMSLDRDLNLKVSADGLVVLIIVVVAVATIAYKIFGLPGFLRKSFEISEAEIGVGDSKIKLSPNVTDMQIAYKIWVELSTRKIGLQIDLKDDVVVEIYDSWYSFFSVTRELIKDVPVQKFRRKDTEKIIKISIDVLNEGIRPHLTKWQARFRYWYEKEMERQDANHANPQEVQKKFDQFDELRADMLLVNSKLMNYRNQMHALIKGS